MLKKMQSFGAQPQAPLRLTAPAPSAVERPPRSARSRAPLGNWAALAPQASVHSRHGWAVVHAEKICPTGRVRPHCAAERSAGTTTRSLEVVPGAAVREFSCTSGLLRSGSLLSAALWLSALPAPRGRGVFACKQVVTVLGVPPRPRGGGHVGSRRRCAETTGAGRAGPRPPDELQVRLPAAVGVEAPGDQQGARLFGCVAISCCRTSRSSERAAAINRRTSRSR